MNGQKIKDAFARSAPHPATPRVRLVSRAEDLCVINHKGVSAAIWRREMPVDVVQALKNIDAAHFPENNGPAEVWLGGHDTVPRNPLLPAAICTDMKRLKEAFRQAAGNPGLENIALYSYRTQEPPRYHDSIETYQPHADSAVALRMLASYTLDPDLVTEWYAVRKGRAEFSLARALKKSRDPEALKKARGVQKEPPGSVMILRGLELPDALVHNIPVPKRDTLRLVYINTLKAL